MKVLIDKTFEKDSLKVSNKKVLYTLADIIENIQQLNKLSDIPN